MLFVLLLNAFCRSQMGEKQAPSLGKWNDQRTSFWLTPLPQSPTGPLLVDFQFRSNPTVCAHSVQTSSLSGALLFALFVRVIACTGFGAGLAVDISARGLMFPKRNQTNCFAIATDYFANKFNQHIWWTSKRASSLELLPRASQNAHLTYHLRMTLANCQYVFSMRMCSFLFFL